MRADLTYCDFLVLAPLELEIDELKNAMANDGWLASTVETSEFPCVVEATSIDSEAAYFRRHAVIVQLNHQGVLNAGVDTARVLELYEPGYVISFGIAGSFDSKDAPIGAVVFATTLSYYEPAKDKITQDKSSTTQSRMDPINVGNNLLNLFRKTNIGDIKSASGPFASGEKLIADALSSTKLRILAANDKTLGVEMEAAGVGKAIHRLCPSAEFVVIKGISDLADKKKGSVSEAQQKANRKIAASNAATYLINLMRVAPLRRSFRGSPSAFEEKMPQRAASEAKQISEILERYGINTNYSQLYACLYGRRRPIPAYYHWRQKSTALHWIDFKILSAIRELPSEIITPMPLVTIAATGIGEANLWRSMVYQLLGIYPTTDDQMRAQYEETHKFGIGLPGSAAQAIRSKLETLQHTGKPEVTLNMMYYMLGQFCHRRMFVFTWKEYREKWVSLDRAFGTWFAIFDWDTINLANKGGKQEAPGVGLLIEPGSYSTLRKWLDSSPPPEVVQEFVDHFKCHQQLLPSSPSRAQNGSREQLEELMQWWEEVFFKPQ